ncbi:MAG: UDP-glucose/GDP-mannose dehydrogenase family protein [Armatimonadetes bacterium]|nr:UDP-glucose/GDP-mannose dehydrogenase family protein [Armatimonadota bacterium]
MDVAVIGTGYVGLVTAACLAEVGHRVIGIDGDADKVARLSQGDPVIYEPGVEELLQRNLANGRLRFSVSIAEGVASSTILFLCVGTPPRLDGSADLSQVEAVSREIAHHLESYRLLVEKSTVPVRTATWIERTLRLYSRGQADFDVASNPEFTREGSAVEDFLHPDRIVLGVPNRRAAGLLHELYAGFDCPKLDTDVSTAEIIKHASNSFLALKISYINLIADLCEAANGDVATVAAGMGLDARIGRAFLHPGLGYGGSCFPKDVLAFIDIGEGLGVDMAILKGVDQVNRGRIGRLVDKLRQALWVLQDKTVAIWGLAFKPHTDDIRGAPALALAERLLKEGAVLRLHDPRAMPRARHVLLPSDRVAYCDSPEQAAIGAHAVVIATEWPLYREVDWAAVRENVATPILVDGRNLCDPSALEPLGFEYLGIGRRA